jgi:nitrite reductase/ring-hydroxylating ferredoxin subunit
MSSPEPWTAVCAEDAVDEGDVIRVEPEGFPPLAVFNVEGTYYVTIDRCTHAEAALSDGTVHGDTIECPFHGGCFHIPSGRATGRPAKAPLTTYEVRVADGEVMVRGPVGGRVG